MVRLISDGGSIIVGRRTASWVWGQFEVTLPEGDQQAPRDERIADGYVYRPDDRETGRFDLTWVRADVNLNMNAEKSDLEATLDAASRRTDGDVFYGREISGPGLGRWRPGVDFQEGSVVEVLLWGKILELPVTSVRPFSTPDEPVGWAVQVGGQPLRDPEAQRKRIHDLWTQIMTERRRALAEEKRLAEQAERDRQQTSAIQSAQSSLSSQQSQIRTWSTSVVNHSDQLAQLLTVLADPDRLNTGLLWSIRDLAMAIQDLAENTQAGRDRALHIANSTASLVTGDMAQIVAIGKFHKLPSVPPPNN